MSRASNYDRMVYAYDQYAAGIQRTKTEKKQLQKKLKLKKLQKKSRKANRK